MIEKKLIKKFDLCDLLANSHDFPKMYWKDRSGEKELLALGASEHFSQLPKNLEQDERVYGSLRFFDDQDFMGFEKKSFFLPKWEIQQTAKETICKSYTPKSLFFPYPTVSFHKKRALVKREDFPNLTEWKKNVDKALEKISQGSLNKVVLARRTDLHFNGPIDPYFILKSFQRLDHVTIFLLQWDKNLAFIGATPEKLYTRSQNKVFIDALAGTRKRGMTQEEDLRRQNDLLSNQKEAKEFSLVEEFLKNTMTPICESFLTKPRNLYSTTYLHHLYSTSSGILKKEISDNDLLQLLHPTPALGGFPKKEALETIRSLEPFSRGLYGAPIGWATEDEADFSVGIRSALVQKNSISIFSGAGIVEQSTPIQEWEELENKIIPFMKVLC